MEECGNVGKRNKLEKERETESDRYKEVNEMENIAGHHLFKIFCK